MRNVFFVSTVTAMILLLYHKPVWGYFDPGLGSMMLQVVLGTIIGILVVARNRVRSIAKKIAAVLRRRSTDGT